MEKQLFSPMEIDALGEMMNISLGSSATAVSNLLEHRVDITTPKVTAIKTEDFALGNLEPAMGIEIKYVEGLAGSNIMLLKRSDIKVIVDILMGGETPDEEFELNELTISAVCEVMNQMMGAAATAMSDFLGYQVDISTPQPFELEDLDAFKQNHLPQGADTIVIVRFSLKIEGALESEFMNVMSVELAKELLKGLGLGDEEEEEEPAPAPEPAPAAEPASSGGKMSQEEIEAMLAGMAGGGAEPEPAPAPEPEPASNKKMSQEEIEAMLTRNGAFVISELMRSTGEVDENGQEIQERVYYLSDNEGRFVLSDRGSMIEVEDEHQAQPVGIFDYMNYDGMEHVNDTRFRAVAKNGGIRQGGGKLMRGFIEMSNADLAEEMTKVIESQRAYGMALKMVQTSDEIETTINSLRS